MIACWLRVQRRRPQARRPHRSSGSNSGEELLSLPPSTVPPQTPRASSGISHVAVPVPLPAPIPLPLPTMAGPATKHDSAGAGQQQSGEADTAAVSQQLEDESAVRERQSSAEHGRPEVQRERGAGSPQQSGSRGKCQFFAAMLACMHCTCTCTAC